MKKKKQPVVSQKRQKKNSGSTKRRKATANKKRRPYNQVKSQKKRPLPAKSKSSKKRRQKKIAQKKQLFLELALSGGLVLIIFCAVFFSLFKIQSNEGYGMMPNLEPGEQVLIAKNEKIRRFSLVAFQTPNRKTDSLRRIIGLPGETVFYKDEQLWVNGEEITERFLLAELQEAKKKGYSLTPDFTLKEIPNLNGTQIPQGYYLVLGDNRSFSIDSREFGLVPAENIYGVAKTVIFPLHKIKSL